MAIATEPDELHEYVPSAEDELDVDGNETLPPELSPDVDPSVLVDDNPDTVGEQLEDAPISDDGFESGMVGPDASRGPEPLYSVQGRPVLGLEIDPEDEATLDDDGDLYDAETGSPTDEAFAAAVDNAPEFESPGSADGFDIELLSEPASEDTGELTPIQYEIQGRSSVAEWHTLAMVSATSMSAEVAGLPTDEGWTFRIRAIYPEDLTGDWSAETSVNLPSDLLAPGVPSAPTLTAQRGVITVHWDGTTASGAPQPADYKHTAVWVSTSGEVGTWTIAGLLFADGGSLPYTFADYNIPYYFSLSSRDLVGNESARSAAASITLKPMVEELEFKQIIDNWDERFDGVITEAEQLSERLNDGLTDLEESKDLLDHLRDTELPDLEQRLTDARDALDALGTELSGELDAAHDELAAHALRLQDAETALESLTSTTLPALQGDLDSALQRLDTAEADIVDAKARLATTEAGLTDLDAIILPALQAEIDATEGRLVDAEAEIDDTKLRVSEAEADIADAFTAVGNAQTAADQAKQDAVSLSNAAKAAAIQEAEAIATSRAAAAASSATTAAAADAKAKADAAQAAAIAAAKTATDLAASGAKQEAIDAAKADAKTKADTAQAAAISAAAADATAKANAAKADATTVAANDATAKANAAQAAAIAAAASDATTKAGLAKTEAIAAATTMTNGIGSNLSSTLAPTTSNAAPYGSVWRRRDSSGRIIGVWEQTAAGIGSTWTPRLLRSETIDNLDLGKLSASSAAINTAVVNKISAQVATVIQLNADRITAGKITSEQVDASSLAVAIASIINLNASRINAGTINTARLNVSELAVQIADVISLNASKITAGTIAAARLDVNDLAVRIANVITLNASKITAGTISTARLDTAAIAAATAAIQKADIKNLTVSDGTFSSAVIDKLWADAITARDLSVQNVAIGSLDNLVPSPRFELDSDWPLWIGGGNPIPIIQNSGGKDGGRRLAIQNSASNATLPGGRYCADFPVEPDASYRVSGWYMTGYNSTTQAKLRVSFPGAGATGGNLVYDVATSVSAGPSEWVKIEGTIKAPSRATTMRVAPMSTSTSVWIYFDDIRVSRMTDGKLIVDGSVDAAAINSQSVSAEVAKFINLDVSRLVASSASLGSAVIDKLWTDVVHSRKITTGMLAVGSFDNILPSPNFDEGGAHWNSSSNGTYGVDDGIGYFETNAVAAQRGVYTSPIPVNGGDEYAFRADVLLPDEANLTLTPSSLAFYVRWRNGSGGETSVLLGNNRVTANMSTKGTVTGAFKVPDAATSIRVGIFVQSNYAKRVRWLKPQGTRVAGATLIADGAIITDKLAANAITADKVAANAITADKVHANAIDGLVITGATMRTNSAGTGVIINNSGIEAKTAAGRQFFLSATTGQMEARGSITTGSDNTYRAKLSNRDGIAALDIYSAGGDAAHHAALIAWDTSVALRRYTNATAYGAELAMTSGFTRLQHAAGGANLNLSPLEGRLENANGGGIVASGTSTTVKSSGGSELLLGGSNVRLTHASGGIVLQSLLYSGAYHTLMPQVEANTTTGSANVNVNAGYIRKTTSASKYKLFPRAFDDSLDDKLLSIDAKHWIDRTEAEETAALMRPETLDEATDPDLDPNLPAPNPMRRVPGVIAEEVRDAGLDEFVVYDADGEVEGVMYDRLGVALIPVVKRQRDRIEQLEDTVAQLLARVEALEAA